MIVQQLHIAKFCEMFHFLNWEGRNFLEALFLKEAAVAAEGRPQGVGMRRQDGPVGLHHQVSAFDHNIRAVVAVVEAADVVASQPIGLREIRHLTGSQPHGQTEMKAVPKPGIKNAAIQLLMDREPGSKSRL